LGVEPATAAVERGQQTAAVDQSFLRQVQTQVVEEGAAAARHEWAVAGPEFAPAFEVAKLRDRRTRVGINRLGEEHHVGGHRSVGPQHAGGASVERAHVRAECGPADDRLDVVVAVACDE
jgi:hypothetical protein